MKSVKMPSKKPQKNVFRQLFDVRPTTEQGFLDLDKILKTRPIVNFTHIIEDYERSFTPRRLKLFVRDYRGNDVFKRYVQIKKPAVLDYRSSAADSESGLITAVPREPEIVFAYSPQAVPEIQVLPSREELLKQLEGALGAAELTSQSVGIFSGKSAMAESKIEIPALSVEKSRFLSFNRRFSFLGMAVLALLLILTFPALNLAEKKIGKPSGVSDALKARENIIKSRDLLAMIDFYGEAKNFEDLGRNLAVSGQKISKINLALLEILENLPKNESGAISTLMEIVRIFNRVSENFASAIDFYSEKNFFAFMVPGSEREETVASLLEKSNRSFEQVISSLEGVRLELDKTERGALPADAAEEIIKLKEKSAELSAMSGGLLESNRFLAEFLGSDKRKRILVAIQNPSVPRASGGLISGYAVMEADKGVLEGFSVYDSFGLDLKLRERVVPPRPLQFFDIAWKSGEANWFFDFPASARKLGWFFEKTAGVKADYTIAASAQFFEDLLKITGAVNLSESQKIVSAENFRDVLASMARPGDSSGYYPKIMAEFFPKLLRELAALEPKVSFQVLDLLNKHLEEKNIIVYSSDSSAAGHLKKIDWSGEIKSSKGNFLSVVDSFFGGAPADFGLLKKNIKHHSEIQPDGRIISTLTVNYSHSSKIKTKLEGEESVRENYLRIFVPAGSELLEADVPEQNVYFPPIDYYAAGFRTDNEVAEMEYNLITDVSGIQIFSEGEKTVFGIWVPVPSGGSRTISVKYRLPLRISGENDFYSFYFQKQPGDYSDFESVLIFPKNLKPTGRSAENLQVSNGLVKLSGRLDKDKYYEVRFAR